MPLFLKLDVSMETETVGRVGHVEASVQDKYLLLDTQY